MRISTTMIFDKGVSSIQNRTSSLLRTQQQISSGRRILTPSDDPVAAAQSLQVGQAQAVNKQFQTAQGNAKDPLGIMDGQLSSVTDLLARVRELAVQGGNGALAGSDRKSIAAELRARYEELVSLANSTDGAGQYLFSGFQGSNKPFAGSVEAGVAYGGDDGQRTLGISGSRQVPISESGNDVFMRIRNGNGTFATGLQDERSANATQVTVEGSNVTNAAPPNSGRIDLRFWTDTANALGGGANAVYYDLVDTAGNSLYTGTPSATGAAGSYTRAFTSGTPIALSSTSPPAATAFDYGSNIVLTGTPQTGDAFALTAGVGTLSWTTTKLTASGARATINAGAVTDPVKWSNGSNSGNLEVRFWVDVSDAIGGGAGKTYYDLVDASNGNSLFTGTASATGAAGSYTHAFTSGAPINFNGLAAAYNPPSNDFGANVTVTGIPASGDAYTVKVNPTDPTGNGYFVTADKMTATANMGSGIIGSGEVLDPSKWNSAANSGKLEVRFWTDPLVTTANPPVYYDLVDATNGRSLFTNGVSVAGGLNNTFTHTFHSGDPIAFSGLAAPYNDLGVTLTISGTPVSGDAFTVQNSGTTSMFENLGNLIRALEGSSGPPGSTTNAELQNKLGFVLTNLGQSVDTIAKTRANIGTRLSEIDDQNSVAQSLDLQYADTLSRLQDVDYSKAITDLTRMQMELQAAQQSFTKISNLSLFNYL
ncbi:MAG: flagellar hook-associated protein FlgL [Rhodocyclaceae bacterium]|jgi:flagellar hook-associated protein 3 FlgL|nr:flagellar hook-associated protein FlgL [Rhodocyclaceae bacterium]